MNDTNGALKAIADAIDPSDKTRMTLKPSQIPPTQPPATAATQAVTTPGADMLSNAAAQALAGAHNKIEQQIDDMIVRLQNMKQAVQLKREEAEQSLRNFISIVGRSLEHVKGFESIVNEIERKHL